MKILTISGSTRTDSANTKLLTAFSDLFPNHSFELYLQIDQLPLFKAESDKHPWPAEVLAWRKVIHESDAIIISIPEYIHNMPALIKNALEWLTSSGELFHKRVLAITFTPNAPRGEKAMQSMLWSLQALAANVVMQFPLYQNEVEFGEDNNLIKNESTEMIIEAIQLLIS